MKTTFATSRYLFVALVFVVLYTPRDVHSNLIHTPVGNNHVQRNLNLISELRNSHRFDVNSDSNFIKNQTMSMTDDLGVQYMCVYVNTTSSTDEDDDLSHDDVKKQDGKKDNANKHTPNDSNDNNPSISSQTTTTMKKNKKLANTLQPNHDLHALRGVCVEFPHGWWTYRWCHKQQVTQYHKEKNGESVGTSWSLGVYDAHKTAIAIKNSQEEKKKKSTTTITPPPPDASSSSSSNDNGNNNNNNNNSDNVNKHGEKFSYYFSNGQHCDETKSGRKSVVHITCCHHNNEANKKKSSNDNGNPSSLTNFIALESLKEKETCSYEINVCTPLACPPEELTPTQKRFSVHALLKPLEKVCMQKHDGWWTYEFCYRHHVRQLHLHTSTNGKGKRETKIQSEFMLGKFQGHERANVNEIENKNSIQQSIESVERKAFVQEYTNGHECGITGQKRSSDVYFICRGKKTVNYIVSVKEDRTCHYNIVINSPLLCEHELLKNKDDIKRQLVCKINN